jgi:hypothetical protein
VGHPSLTLLLADASDSQAATVRAGLQAAHVDAILLRTHGVREALELLRGGGGRDPLHARAVLLLSLALPDASDCLKALRQEPVLARTVVFGVGPPSATGPLLRDLSGQVLGGIDPEAPEAGCRQVRELVDHYLLMSQAPAD